MPLNFRKNNFSIDIKPNFIKDQLGIKILTRLMIYTEKKLGKNKSERSQPQDYRYNEEVRHKLSEKN